VSLKTTLFIFHLLRLLDSVYEFHEFQLQSIRVRSAVELDYDRMCMRATTTGVTASFFLQVVQVEVAAQRTIAERFLDARASPKSCFEVRIRYEKRGPIAGEARAKPSEICIEFAEIVNIEPLPIRGIAQDQTRLAIG
jgi:hypothetical protein